MQKIISVLVSVVTGIVFMMFLMVCILTPEKTADGSYTNPVKYWTDDNYLQSNFNRE